MKHDDMYGDLHAADVLRSLEAAAGSWKNDELTLDDMCDQLDALGAVADGSIDYAQFIHTTGVKGIQYN